MKNCSTCERRFKVKTTKNECQAFSEIPKNCWAWTDDPNWLDKVNEAVDEYKLNHTHL